MKGPKLYITIACNVSKFTAISKCRTCKLLEIASTGTTKCVFRRTSRSKAARPTAATDEIAAVRKLNCLPIRSNCFMAFLHASQTAGYLNSKGGVYKHQCAIVASLL